MAKRLIIAPQYPIKLRYQEWWFTEFKKQFANYFDEVIMLGEQFPLLNGQVENAESFSNLDLAVQFDIWLVSDFLHLDLRDDDYLLVNDISFPGIFPSVLYLKRPKNCFGICHATSRNRYDIFSKVRSSKWLVEKGYSRLFKKVFVASNYHKAKLGWRNAEVVPFPLPNFNFERKGTTEPFSHDIVSVARKGIQKTTVGVEKVVEKFFESKIERPDNVSSWEEYYEFLANSKFMLITAKEETFGYQVVDAVLNNCIPIAPNAYSYPELVPHELLYDDVFDILVVIETYKNREFDFSRFNLRNDFYQVVFEEMVNGA